MAEKDFKSIAEQLSLLASRGLLCLRNRKGVWTSIVSKSELVFQHHKTQ